MSAVTLTRRYGRLLFVGKGPAISAQLQAMARREGFHIEYETRGGNYVTAPAPATSQRPEPSLRVVPVKPLNMADVLESLRKAPLVGRVPSIDFSNTQGERLS